MRTQARRLTVFVDEADRGCFYWVLIESTQDAAEWEDIGSSEEPFDTWKEAFDAGVSHLRSLIDDEAIGPRVAGEDENASPAGTPV